MFSSDAFGDPADRTRSHLGVLPVDQGDRTQYSCDVSERDRQSHGLTDDLTAEAGGMCDATIDWIRVDVVSAGGFESAVGVGADWPNGIAERAADVDVDVGVADYQTGVVTAPGSDDIGDGCRGSGGAREDREDRREYEDPRHTQR